MTSQSRLWVALIIVLSLIFTVNAEDDKSAEDSSAERPYKFVPPLSANQFMSRRIGTPNQKTSSSLDSDPEDQMAIESKKVEEKVDRVPSKKRHQNVLKRRRIEIKPFDASLKSRIRNTVASLRKQNNAEKMPEFPNFPQIFSNSSATTNVPAAEEKMDKVDSKSGNPETIMVAESKTEPEMLPKPLPLMKMRRDRLNNHKVSDRRIESLPVNLTPKAEPYRRSPDIKSPAIRVPQEYEYYYDDYDYDDYFEDLTYKSRYPPKRPPPKKSAPPPSPIKYLSKPKPKPKSKPKRPSPPRSTSLTRWANHKERISPIMAPPPKMSHAPKYSAPSSLKQRRLKNHRLEEQQPYYTKSDRYNAQRPALPAQTQVKPELNSSPSKNRHVYNDYEYYDDEYYDDFYIEPKKRRRQGYGGGGGGSINPLALLVAPLAAISLLAAAAAVAINPVLVQVSFTGRRRKRSAMTEDEDDWNPDREEKMHEMQVLEKFLGSIPDNTKYQQQILSMYLSCSGYTEPSHQCLDRVVCDYSTDSESSVVQQEEKDVISIILYNIMANDFVGEEYKNRLRTAARIGRDEGSESCKKSFVCSELDQHQHQE